MTSCLPPDQPITGQESLGFLVALLRGELVRGLETALAAEGIGLRYSQFLVLKRLATQGTMSASELARSLGHDAGAMTRLLDQLEAKGYLVRRPHEQDRRALRIELTEAGVALWRHMAAANERLLEHAQGDLSAEERSRLHDYLVRVLNTLRATDPV